MQRIGREKQRIEALKGPKFDNLDDCQHPLQTFWGIKPRNRENTKVLPGLGMSLFWVI